MKWIRTVSIESLFLCVGCAVVANAQIKIFDTTVPNSFWFSQDTYVVAPGSDRVEVTVLFQPGNRGYSGSIQYFTKDDTAQRTVDYQAVDGVLQFSGVPNRTFEIPIVTTAPTSSAGPKRFVVCIANAEKEILAAAQVVIESTPRLQLARTSKGLLISWPAGYEGYVIEKSAAPDFANATTILSPPVRTGNFWQIEEPASEPMVFYRLTKPVRAADSHPRPLGVLGSETID